MLFLVITSTIYVSVVIVLGYFQIRKFTPNFYFKVGASRYSYTRNRELKKFKNVDILFLGSSAAMRGFDTRIFKNHGYHTFNLGSNSQAPVVTKVLINRYLADLNPKLVIFQVSTVNLSIDGIQSALDIITNDKNDIHSFKMSLALNNIKIYNAWLFGIIRDYFNFNSDFYEDPIKGLDTYVSGGYVARKIQYFKTKPIKNMSAKQIDIQISAFNDIINILNQKKINYILVNVPFTSKAYNTCKFNAAFDSIMTSKATYINFNKTLKLNDSLDFFDEYHLNQNGVDIMNEKLIEILECDTLLMQNGKPFLHTL